MSEAPSEITPETGGAIGAAAPVVLAAPLKPTWPSRGPWRRFPGPLVLRDIAKSSRRAGTYWLRFGVVLVLLGVMAITVMSIQPFGRGGEFSSVATLQQMQRIAPGIVLATIWFEYIVLGLLSAGMTAMAISGERQAGTLWALLSTPLRSWEIALGKMLAGGAQLLVLGMLPLPVLLALRIFGGISAGTLLLSLSIVVSTVVCGLACGLSASVGARTSSRAMSAAIGLLAMQQFGVAIGMGLVNSLSSSMVIPTRAFVWTTPAIALGAISISETAPITRAHPVTLAMAAAAWNVGWATLLFVYVTVRLRRVAESGGFARPQRQQKRNTNAPSGDGAPKQSDEAEAEPGVLRPRNRRTSGAREGTSREVSDSPVLWRECAIPIFASKFSQGLVIVLIVFGFMLDILWAGYSETVLHGFVAGVGLLLVTVGAITTSSGVFTSERESRTWDILLSTPLSAWQIVRGKYIGVLRRNWLVPMIVALHFGVSWAVGNTGALPAGCLVLLIAPTGALCAAMGTFSSLLVKTTPRAVSLGLMAIIGLWLAVPLVLSSMTWLLENYVRPEMVEKVTGATLTFNPFAMLFLVIDVLDRQSRQAGGQGGTINYFGTGQVTYLAVGAGVLAYAGAAGIATITLLRLAARHLRKSGLRR